MATILKRGNIQKRKESTKFEWNITDFSSVSENSVIKSPSFYFADASWSLLAIFKSFSKPGFMVLYLMPKHLQCAVKYHVGLKKVNCSVEGLSQGVLEENGYYIDICSIKLSEIEQRKSELVPLDTLTVTCTLKHAVTDPDQPEALDFPKFKKLKRLHTLSDNFRNLFTNKDSCDTTLHVMGREYKAHKTVLMARSPVFAAMFLHETSEKQTGIVNIPDLEPESFEEFLEFLYTGKLEKPFSRSALHLYEIADKYDVLELKTFCLEFMKESLTIENLCDIVIFADKYDEKDLLYAAEDYFIGNVKEIIETSKWDSLVKNNYSLSKKLLKEALSVKNVR